MSQILKSLREKRGSADTHHKTPPVLVEKWRVEVGTHRLWIIGPGAHAMHAASASYYSGRIGTDLERQIAQRAVQILDRTHRDREAGKSEIQAALDQAEDQISKGLPIDPACESPTSEPLPGRGDKALPAITPEDAKRILAAGQTVTGILSRVFMDLTTANCRRPLRCRARAMCYAAAKQLFPHQTNLQIAQAFGVHHGKHGIVAQNLGRHDYTYLREDEYAAQFKNLISNLS